MERWQGAFTCHCSTPGTRDAGMCLSQPKSVIAADAKAPWHSTKAQMATCPHFIVSRAGNFAAQSDTWLHTHFCCRSFSAIGSSKGRSMCTRSSRYFFSSFFLGCVPAVQERMRLALRDGK